MKIVAFPRTEKGSGASRRLRNAGMAPGIVYGGTSSPVSIKLDHNALFYALKREAFHSSILDLEIEGKVEKVLLRDFQTHAFKPLVLHVDFQRVSADQKITVKVPLHFLNEADSPAVKLSAGLIHHTATDLEISCLPGQLPEFIEVDLSQLDVGHSIHLSDLKLPAGVTTAAQDDTQAIATAVAQSAAPAENAAEGDAKTATDSKE